MLHVEIEPQCQYISFLPSTLHSGPLPSWNPFRGIIPDTLKPVFVWNLKNFIQCSLLPWKKEKSPPTPGDLLLKMSREGETCQGQSVLTVKMSFITWANPCPCVSFLVLFTSQWHLEQVSIPGSSGVENPKALFPSREN